MRMVEMMALRTAVQKVEKTVDSTAAKSEQRLAEKLAAKKAVWKESYWVVQRVVWWAAMKGMMLAEKKVAMTVVYLAEQTAG